MRQRLCCVAATQRHHAGQGQRLGLVRLRGQRLRHRRDGGVVGVALVGRKQRVGQIGQHGRLPRHEAQHLLVGRYRVRVASQGFIRTRQHIPAIRVIGRRAQPLRQRVNGQRHVIAGFGRMRFGGLARAGDGRRARIAQLAIQQHGRDGDEHGQQAGGRYACALPGPGRAAGAPPFQVLQQVALQFFLGASSRRGAEAAIAHIALQLFALREIEGANIGVGCGFRGGSAAQQGGNQAEQGRQQQAHHDQPESGHEPVSRKRVARSRSSAVRGARAPARRFKVRTNMTKPSASSANGPSHSSQVMGLKGGS